MSELAYKRANSHAPLIAGILSGMAGLLVFLIIHHVWILPIWFVVPFGLVIAGLGGAAAGWAYSLLAPHLPTRPWTALALMLLIWAVLLPGLLLAELRPPYFDINTGESAVLAVPVGRVALGFLLELMLTAVLVGALLGRLLGGTRQAAMAMAIAGLIFALGPGHNIPFIGGTGGVWKEIAIMAPVIAVSAVVLVEAEAWLFTNGRQPTGEGAHKHRFARGSRERPSYRRSSLGPEFIGVPSGECTKRGRGE